MYTFLESLLQRTTLTCLIKGCIIFSWASLVAETVKSLPAMWETGVQYLGEEESREKEMATHSSILGFPLWLSVGFPGGSEVKASTCNAGDPGSITGSGRVPGEGNGNPL